LDIKVLYTNS